MNDSLAPLSAARWRRLIPIAFITYSFAYVDRSNYSIGAAGGLVDKLHITSAQSGLLGGLFFIGYFLFQVPAGSFAERRSITRSGPGQPCTCRCPESLSSTPDDDWRALPAKHHDTDRCPRRAGRPTPLWEHVFAVLPRSHRPHPRRDPRHHHHTHTRTGSQPRWEPHRAPPQEAMTPAPHRGAVTTPR